MESGFAIAFGIVFGSLVSEDLALLGAVAASRSQILSVPIAFIAAAGGIFFGDLLLYAVGRLLKKKRVNSFKKKGFARAGVFLARFIPGTRLPVYLSVGALGMSVTDFAITTGVAVFVWTGLGFFLGSFLPTLEWIRMHGIWFVLVVAALSVVTLGLSQRLRNSFWIFLRMRFYRVLRFRYFEFWPMWLFYPPVVLYGVWLAIKYRSIRAPLDANPGVENGGVIGESKSAILASFSGEAECLEYEIVSSVEAALGWMNLKDQSYPVVLKPDVGQRGSGVRVVRTEAELMNAFLEAHEDSIMIIQEYCDFTEEVGVNYVRYPDQDHGAIVGITRKRFPVVIGDGVHTLTELVLSDERARYIADTYLKRFPKDRDRIINIGEDFRLVETGNHCQGTIFEDGGCLWSHALEVRLDALVKKVPGVYTGRFDLRFSDEAELMAGRGFKIIELNVGAGEATHIYDARKTLREAYGILFEQLRVLFRIGMWLQRERS